MVVNLAFSVFSTKLQTQTAKTMWIAPAPARLVRDSGGTSDIFKFLKLIRLDDDENEAREVIPKIYLNILRFGQRATFKLLLLTDGLDRSPARPSLAWLWIPRVSPPSSFLGFLQEEEAGGRWLEVS